MPSTKKRQPKPVFNTPERYLDARPTAKKRAKAPEEIAVVRLKRYNPKRGHNIRQYLVWGYVFKELQNWYKIPAKINYLGEVKNLKEYLENVHQDNEDPESPLAFDVVTEKEAALITKQEREAEERKAYNLRGNGDPVDMTGRRGKRGSSQGDERGDLSLDDVRYDKAATRRKFPRSMAAVDE